MRWDRYDGEGIEVQQQKTDELLWIPCHSRLKEALDRHKRKSEFILTTQLGSCYSDGAFCNMIAEATAQIGAKEYTAHGLRKNAAKALADAGCTVHQIMAITGHKTLRQAMHYTKQANQRDLAQEAMKARTKVANRRTSKAQKSG